jgi:hypothetical protein
MWALLVQKWCLRWGPPCAEFIYHFQAAKAHGCFQPCACRWSMEGETHLKTSIKLIAVVTNC